MPYKVVLQCASCSYLCHATDEEMSEIRTVLKHEGVFKTPCMRCDGFMKRQIVSQRIIKNWYGGIDGKEWVKHVNGYGGFNVP